MDSMKCDSGCVHNVGISLKLNLKDVPGNWNIGLEIYGSDQTSVLLTVIEMYNSASASRLKQELANVGYSVSTEAVMVTFSILWYSC